MSYTDFLIDANLWLLLFASVAQVVYSIAAAVERHDSGKAKWPFIALAALGVLLLTFCFATIGYRAQA